MRLFSLYIAASRRPRRRSYFCGETCHRVALSKEDESDLKREVAILKRMNHANIVRLLDFFEEPMTYIIVQVAEGRFKKALCNEKL